MGFNTLHGGGRPFNSDDGPKFARVSPSNPCPLCGCTQWHCYFLGDGVVCRDTSDGKPMPNGGWYHAPGTFPAVPAERLKMQKAKKNRCPDQVAKLKSIQDEYALRGCQFVLSRLAGDLGLPVGAMDLIAGIGLRLPDAKYRRHCWTFPEYDGDERLVGISYRVAGPFCEVTQRFGKGSKGFEAGSNRGLFLATNWVEAGKDDVTFFVEGASDTLTCAAAGLSAVGRYNNVGGVSELHRLAHRKVRDERKLVWMGEYDRKPDGSHPGDTRAQAQQLANALGREILFAFPPDGAKDVRDWFMEKCEPDADWAACGRAFREKVLRFAVVVRPNSNQCANELSVAVPNPGKAGSKEEAQQPARAKPGQPAAMKDVMSMGREGDGQSVPAPLLTASNKKGSGDTLPPEGAGEGDDDGCGSIETWPDDIREITDAADGVKCRTKTTLPMDGIALDALGFCGRRGFRCGSLACAACHAIYRADFVTHAAGIANGEIGLDAAGEPLTVRVFVGTEKQCEALDLRLARRTKKLREADPAAQKHGWIKVEEDYRQDERVMFIFGGPDVNGFQEPATDRTVVANMYADYVKRIARKDDSDGKKGWRPVTASKGMLPLRYKEPKYALTRDPDGKPFRERSGLSNAEHAEVCRRLGGFQPAHGDEGAPVGVAPTTEFGAKFFGPARTRWLAVRKGLIPHDAPDLRTYPLDGIAFAPPGSNVHPVMVATNGDAAHWMDRLETAVTNLPPRYPITPVRLDKGAPAIPAAANVFTVLPLLAGRAQWVMDQLPTVPSGRDVEYQLVSDFLDHIRLTDRTTEPVAGTFVYAEHVESAVLALARAIDYTKLAPQPELPAPAAADLPPAGGAVPSPESSSRPKSEATSDSPNPVVAPGLASQPNAGSDSGGRAAPTDVAGHPYPGPAPTSPNFEALAAEVRCLAASMALGTRRWAEKAISGRDAVELARALKTLRAIIAASPSREPD